MIELKDILFYELRPSTKRTKKLGLRKIYERKIFEKKCIKIRQTAKLINQKL